VRGTSLKTPKPHPYHILLAGLIKRTFRQLDMCVGFGECFNPPIPTVLIRFKPGGRIKLTMLIETGEIKTGKPLKTPQKTALQTQKADGQ